MAGKGVVMEARASSRLPSSSEPQPRLRPIMIADSIHLKL